MKVYTVERQNKFDYDFSVELLKIGCFFDKAKAIVLAKEEFESMQGEYEDEMLKYSDMYRRYLQRSLPGYKTY